MAEGNKDKVRTPQQRRSVKSKERLKVTAQHLFTRKGFHAVNSNQIASEAGVSVGTFYAYFKDKRALLLEMLINFQERFLAKIFRNQNPEMVLEFELKEIIRTYVTKVFKAFEISPGLLKVAYPMRYYDEEIDQIFHQSDQAEYHQIHLLFKALKDRIYLKDIDAAVVMIHSAIAGVVHRSKLLGMEIEENRLIDELTTMLFRYIKT